jgi:tripartite-type tricarboxylate transporter receptor subunit TctC
MWGKKHNKSVECLLSFLVFIVAVGWVKSEIWAAEKYPIRPIQVITCYSPGSTDMAARPFVEKLPEYFGQPVSIVYKPGAGGSIGGSYVAKAKPDGYTLIWGSTGSIITPPITLEGLDYTVDDFIPICRMVGSPVIVCVKGDSKFKTIKDIVEAAKKSPGNLTYSSAGFGITIAGNIPWQMFLKSAGINITDVPCDGSKEAITALLGGHVNMTSSAMANPSPHIKSGALRAIGVFTKERLKEFPDVPTFTESGYPIVFTARYGFMAPKKVPVEVVRTISTACTKIVNDHKKFLEDRLGKVSFILDLQLNPEEFAKEVQEEKILLKKIGEDLAKSQK